MVLKKHRLYTVNEAQNKLGRGKWRLLSCGSPEYYFAAAHVLACLLLFAVQQLACTILLSGCSLCETPVCVGVEQSSTGCCVAMETRPPPPSHLLLIAFPVGFSSLACFSLCVFFRKSACCSNCACTRIAWRRQRTMIHHFLMLLVTIRVLFTCDNRLVTNIGLTYAHNWELLSSFTVLCRKSDLMCQAMFDHCDIENFLFPF